VERDIDLETGLLRLQQGRVADAITHLDLEVTGGRSNLAHRTIA
jgi:hypothetical protein